MVHSGALHSPTRLELVHTLPAAREEIVLGVSLNKLVVHGATHLRQAATVSGGAGLKEQRTRIVVVVHTAVSQYQALPSIPLPCLRHPTKEAQNIAKVRRVDNELLRLA